MGVLDVLRGRGFSTLVESTALVPTPSRDVLAEQLTAERDNVEILYEALADAELALEDSGWRRLGAESAAQLSRAGLKTATDLCRAMATTNALARRGVALRVAYVWGDGVQIAARATGNDTGEQNVNAVVQAFCDDEGNRASFTGEQAHEENERALATDGNLLLACFTAPKTGSVQVRVLPWEEIDDSICNPQDRTEVWWYRRVWTATTREVDGSTAQTQQVDYYPALGYRPVMRPQRLADGPIHWDSPVLHVSVNRAGKWGVPDLFTALPWTRAYRDFLADWAQLVRALSRFAWRQSSGKGSKTAQVAAKARAAAGIAARTPPEGATSTAGATAVMSPDVTLEAIPKTGATIDSESGRPLAAMIAAALDVPVTQLLGDPGVTGARATAETLDRPTYLSMGMRRTRWSEAHRKLFGYVIMEAVRAPGGPLRGKITRDEHGREQVTLAGDTDTTVETTWPPLDKVDPTARMAAVKIAADLGVLPKLEIARIALEALEEDNIDEVLADLVDDDGNFIDPDVDAGVVAVRAFRAGRDPAQAVQ